MKQYLSILLIFLIAMTMIAETTKLPTPSIDKKASLSEALANRKSTREFGGGTLTAQQTSNLLWAAYGITREDGKLVVPAALNRHAFTLYLMTAKGVERFNAKDNTLTTVVAKDLRAMAEGRKTLGPAAAAVVLLVADTTVFKDMSGNGDFYLGVEAGAICQDIYLYAAAEKWNALCCGSVDAAGLSKALELPATQKPVLTMIVGPGKTK
ncbi:MAG: nitroreductase family protein [Lentisphaeria bacterium]|nr:nitroreductase family protein [Lentisphaeria bacterium]